MSEADPSRPLLITRWARRSAPTALAPGYARLDERDLCARVADSLHFAHGVRFFDTTDAEAGTWDSLLAADGSLLLALIGALDLDPWSDALAGAVRRLRREGDSAAREHAFHEALRDLIRLARAIDRWLGPVLHAAAGSDGAGAFAVRMLDLLGPHLRRVIHIVRAAERAGHLGAIVIVIPDFHHGWGVELSEVDWEWRTDRHWLHEVADTVGDSIHHFLTELGALVAEARTAFDATLDHAAHPPHTGLLLAFLSLFQRSQDRLNALPGRIAGHYFGPLGQAMARRPVPDRVYLTFRRAKSAPRPPIVPQGHVFRAGKAEFAADSSLPVTGASVPAVHLWVPEGGDNARRLLGCEIPLADDGTLPAEPPPLSPLAAGLIVSGEGLRSHGGSQTVTLTLTVSGCAWPLWQAEPFDAFVQRAFGLALPSPDGWHGLAFDAGASTVHADAARAVFTFAMPPEEPPPEPGTPAIEVAALRLVLLQPEGATPSPLSVFAGAAIEAIRIDVAVEGLSEITLTTPSGSAAAVAGIPAFGPSGARGTWLQLEHPALRRGGIDRLRATLVWADLPPNPDGFTGYYREYVVGLDRALHTEPLFTDELFVVEVSAGEGPGPRAVAPLFQREPPPVPPTPAEVLAGDVPRTPLARTSTFELAGGGGAEAGCALPGAGLRLTLIAPDYGFGELLYPPNVAYATAVSAHDAGSRRPAGQEETGLAPVFANLLKMLGAPFRALGALLKRLKGDADELLLHDGIPQEEEAPAESLPEPGPQDATARLEALMPNPPWRPLLAGASLAWEAHFSYSPGEPQGADIRLFHWHPFEGPVPLPPGGGCPLLPALPAAPALDIALRGVPAGMPLSLLLETAPGAAGCGAVTWFAQSADGWTPLFAREVQDGTAGLTVSGIATLGPAAAQTGCLRVQGETAAPSLTAIRPDALSATRSIDAADASVDPIPAASIASLEGLTGITAILQPLASFGGRSAEAPEATEARVAERLRHRRRAVLDWDYERIILDAFPEVARVRVLPSRGPDGAPEAGAVLLVVVPAAGGPAAIDVDRPQLPPSLRDAVAKEIGRTASPFARVTIVGPAYARVDVTVSAALARNTAPGTLERDIRSFLSPLSDAGLDLSERASAAEIADVVLRRVRALPYVEAAADASASFADATPPPPWAVPVAGTIVVEQMNRGSFGL